MAKRTGGFIGQDGINAPDQATGVTGTAGDTQVDVSFTSPSDVGGADVTEYRVTDSTGAHTASGSASPVTVTGLTNGTSYTFNVWAINPFGWSTASDASGSVSPVAPAFGLFFGGLNASNQRTEKVDRIDITSTGNGTYWGDLNFPTRYNVMACGSATRSIAAGGNNGSDGINNIDYINPTGGGGYTSDFGDLSGTIDEGAGCSNSTRGLFGGGVYNGSGGSNVINYITIATLGNSADYGDLTVGRSELASCASPTRGIFAGGGSNVIDYVTIASTGNATDFGDLNISRTGHSGASNSTRGLFAGNNSGSSNSIEYITIASTGNGTDFGDLTENKSQRSGGAASPTRAVFAGGFNGSESSNVIDFVTIGTTGNATDFGDLNTERRSTAGASSNHGGLS
jgi:hypothetical protein